MDRSYHRWFSPNLGRDMEVLVFGQAGMRVLAFPTSRGRFWEWEQHGMVHALSGQLDAGRMQLFCIDGVDEESWYAWHKWPGDRAWRHVQYDAYVLREAVPFTAQVNPQPFLTVVGPSFGAYHAVNFTLRHPEVVNRVLGLSGIYDIRRFTSGHYDNNIYFNNPCDYLANEAEPRRLEALRRPDIILAVGRTDPLLEDSRRLSGLLWSKGIWHALRLWDGFAHDWPVWDRMLHLYLHGHD
jgi:esterase/lipase superfamily enzyme